VARAARIRSGLEVLLTLPGLDVPGGTLGPYLDFLVEKIVADAQPPDAPEGQAA
jgi:hypothetical protein